MAINEETLVLLDGMRTGVGTHVDQVTQDLTLAWSRAWNEVAAEWEAAIADLVAASKDGKWPPASKVRRARRALRARDATRELLKDLQGLVPVRVVQDVDALLEDVTEWQRRLTASQFPPQAGGTAVVASGFDLVDKDAIRAIVDRTSKDVVARSRPLSAQADAAMRSSLVKGVAVGDHPETAAREMVARVQGAFDGGLQRAKVIARTELLDAHRAASRAQQDRLAGQGVVTGWQWIATLDQRTCPSCLSMHGTQHPPTVAGPLDHQQGRCDRLPVAASWKDLGFPDLEEPEPILPDARVWFDGLPQSQRVQIMGAQRLALLDSGQVGWADLAKRRDTDGWRPSIVPTPVRDLAS
ncbi:phage minor head protein [Janibacter terrae]|uniref:phage minor head protein n=1 Tax=Janibacter terrae TaxID=103817 RepID=UPI0031F83B2F